MAILLFPLLFLACGFRFWFGYQNKKRQRANGLLLTWVWLRRSKLGAWKALEKGCILIFFFSNSLYIIWKILCGNREDTAGGTVFTQLVLNIVRTFPNHSTIHNLSIPFILQQNSQKTHLCDANQYIFCGYLKNYITICSPHVKSCLEMNNIIQLSFLL